MPQIKTWTKLLGNRGDRCKDLEEERLRQRQGKSRSLKGGKEWRMCEVPIECQRREKCQGEQEPTMWGSMGQGKEFTSYPG